MNAKIFEQSRQYAFRRLKQELPANLYYHSFSHTSDEVVPAAEMLANMEGVSGNALQLLLIAAWFHDLGHVEQTAQHELISARIAVQVLSNLGCPASEVEVVRWAILATALPQQPRTPLEEILTDADLSVLASKNFATRNHDLRRELASFEKEYSDLEWYRNQVKFFEEHRYFTASARALKNAAKEANLSFLKQKLAALEK